MVFLFNVFVFFIVVEVGYVVVVSELLKFLVFVSMVLMGFMVVMWWKEKDGCYLFVVNFVMLLVKDWLLKFVLVKMMLLFGVLSF